MHPPHVRAATLQLVDSGVNDCEIARRTGIPRGTVRDMRRYRDDPRRYKSNLTETCPRCWRQARAMRFSFDDYAELLGLYLGDGVISEGPRTSRLRIILDAKYPGIVQDARELLRRCFPSNDVHVGKGSRGDFKGSTGNCLSVSVYCSHLKCLFPQHGPGRKHARRIVLEPWQQTALATAPWEFLRGCIRSDGCVFVNRTGPYEYLSYEFSNRSEDIARLFAGVSADLGLRPRINEDREGRWSVRINRRESVASMLERVGRKA
jgi:LAGLIDADG-like domain